MMLSLLSWRPWKVTAVKGNNHQEATRSFYSQALTQAERVRLSRARRIEGLDEEIALIRLRLHRLAKEHPDRLELLIKGMRLLIQAVAAKYRLSPNSQEDLFHNVMGVLRGIGDALRPEGTDGA